LYAQNVNLLIGINKKLNLMEMRKNENRT
jgi:hypothetical protein